VLAAVHELLIAQRATDALATACSCLGPCFDGPTAVVYPDGVWYGGLAPGDAAGLVAHLRTGVRVAAREQEPPGE
jgi:(2Fe-2S) ferredoxin